MKFEEVLPLLRDGKAIQRASQPIKWAYLKKGDNGNFFWYGYWENPDQPAPMNIDHQALMADDWQVVDESQTRGLKPESTFNCPRRSEQGRNPDDMTHLFDHWRENAHNTEGGKHSCSYCGSIHPDEFMQAVRDGVEIGPTDKSYKAYMSGPGFNHAKFYFQHLSAEQRTEFLALVNDGKVKIGSPGHFYVLPFFCVRVSEEAPPAAAESGGSLPESLAASNQRTDGWENAQAGTKTADEAPARETQVIGGGDVGEIPESLRDLLPPEAALDKPS